MLPSQPPDYFDAPPTKKLPVIDVGRAASWLVRTMRAQHDAAATERIGGFPQACFCQWCQDARQHGFQ